MWGNTGTLWGLCNKFQPLWWGKCGDLDFALLSGRMWGLRFCSTERRLGTIDCSLDRWWQDSPDRFKTESGEFRTGRKVEIFTRLRAANVVFKKKYLKFNFHQNAKSECLLTVQRTELSSLTHWAWDSRKQIQSYALTRKLLFLTHLRFLAPLVKFLHNKLCFMI